MSSYSFLRSLVRSVFRPIVRLSIGLSRGFDWSLARAVGRFLRPFVGPFEGVRNPCRLGSDKFTAARMLSVGSAGAHAFSLSFSETCSLARSAHTHTHKQLDGWTDTNTDTSFFSSFVVVVIAVFFYISLLSDLFVFCLPARPTSAPPQKIRPELQWSS